MFIFTTVGLLFFGHPTSARDFQSIFVSIMLLCRTRLRSRLVVKIATTMLLLLKNIHALDRTEHEHSAGNYYIGTGIYDMTGPASEINLMGYAKAEQIAHGIHMRLRARAFIVSEKPALAEEEATTIETLPREDDLPTEEEGRARLLRWSSRSNAQDDTKTETRPSDISHLDPERTVCFVSIDAGMGSDLLNTRVLERLKDLLPVQGHSNKRLCHLENLSISGTHTHSAPGGFIQYALYQITSLGFSTEVMDAYVEGISQSILRAFSNLEKGTISMGQDFLFNANINRSPTSYLLNPQGERELYEYEGDTDKRILQLKFSSHDGMPKGILNWFAVHGTSMNASNLLLSGDNKGYASYLFEKHINGNKTLPGKGKFVAAFASTNLGDVSPNTAGPRCVDTGLPCDLQSSTCNGNSALCIASGPGKDMKESTEIIGRKQYEAALAIFHNDTESLSGSVAFRHSFIDMSNRTVTLETGEVVRTCPAALGYGFAAGTTDGPGSFAFEQGKKTSNPFWNTIGSFLSVPSDNQRECHHPKPILLNTGEAKRPYAWDPNSVPISLFKIGRLFILSVPCEFTTMAGRRLRRFIRALLIQRGFDEPEITIAGLANSYTHYVTTFEEYSGQRYEAASTLYGPHTLSAYIQEFGRLVNDLFDGKKSATDDPPADLLKKQWSLIPPVGLDLIGVGQKFGSVAVETKDSYVRGTETVSVSFRSANPRNNLRTEDTFLTVDILLEDGTWETRYSDGDWSTSFFWHPSVDFLGASFARISWEIPNDATQGLYRICHYGTRKTLFGGAEWMTINSPDWLSIDGFGSIALGILIQALKIFEILSEYVRSAIDGLSRFQTKDFDGCSRSFLVRSS